MTTTTTMAVVVRVENFLLHETVLRYCLRAAKSIGSKRGKNWSVFSEIFLFRTVDRQHWEIRWNQNEAREIRMNGKDIRVAPGGLENNGSIEEAKDRRKEGRKEGKISESGCRFSSPGGPSVGHSQEALMLSTPGSDGEGGN